MKTMMYLLTQKIVSFGLFCYFREVKLHGIETVPRNKPVLFLANHQNALLDPLVIAAVTPFRSYFLTRADVFTNPVVNQVFSFLRMLPIYRMRDGRDTLGKNEAIFRQCTQLLNKSEAILLFPEANHNIMRRVRPLSKGFTRILFATLDQYPALDVQLVPVGINYKKADAFRDSVAFYFGEPISSRALYDHKDHLGSVATIKERVYEALKEQTTHIDEQYDYLELLHYLDGTGADYLNPQETNLAINNYQLGQKHPGKTHPPRKIKVATFIFEVINMPMLLIWRKLIKPRIDEIEFVSTYRFSFALLFQPVFYLLVWFLLATFIDPITATAIVLVHFLYNLAYVKLRRP
ncbi:MAG: lysophospholipid acyltransferase family protein [Muriicola sp.]